MLMYAFLMPTWVIGTVASWLRRNRIVAILCALWIAFVPAGWAVEPAWTRWGGSLRAIVLGSWAAAALLIVITAYRQTRQVDDLMGEALDSRRIQQDSAGFLTLRLLLRHRCSGLQPYCLELFVPDKENGGVLYAVSSSDEVVTETRWEPGRGATGYAFLTGERVIVRGSQVHDGTYGLSQEQKARYRDKGTAIVVAMPVKNVRGRTIGVLTADGPTDTGYFSGEQAFDEHLELAVAAARVLIGLFQWDTDAAERSQPGGTTVRKQR
ncbi:MAG: hypothetical protein JWO62_2042 [Acidimicrobiaceae bacterium]|nr:hypothetical protein [Acidimicrobiaceae bacterium]